jgi:hypothetical protein
MDSPSAWHSVHRELHRGRWACMTRLPIGSCSQCIGGVDVLFAPSLTTSQFAKAESVEIAPTGARRRIATISFFICAAAFSSRVPEGKYRCNGGYAHPVDKATVVPRITSSPLCYPPKLIRMPCDASAFGCRESARSSSYDQARAAKCSRRQI